MLYRPVNLDSERIVGLVFELASQLQVERAQRIALELALERAGVLKSDAVGAVAGDAELKARSTAELNQSMAKLLRVITEIGDARGPLRHEGLAPANSGAT
jgi:hypothetical protein